MNAFRWLKNPWFVLLGVVLGILLGVFQQPLALMMAPIGELYLSFLRMLVVPIMMTAVISSLGQLLLAKTAGRVLKRIVLVFAASLFMASAVGLAAGLVGNPGGGLSAAARDALGQVLTESEAELAVELDRPTSVEEALSFLGMVVPDNIFLALLEGKNLQILFVSILFGVAVGVVPTPYNGQFLAMMEVVFKACERVIAWAMYLLPLGLMCMIADQVARAGIDVLLSMTKFVVLVHAAAVVLLLFSTLAIRRTSGHGMFRSLRQLREVLLFAFVTRNSFAAMPAMFDVLKKHYRIQDQVANLVVPLGIILCRYSMVLIFSLGTLFIAQLYGVSLGVADLLFVFAGSVVAAVAGAGAPGIVALTMMGMVLGPIGLPAGAAITLMMAANPLIDPILTVANVHLTCACAVWIDRAKAEDAAPALDGGAAKL